MAAPQHPLKILQPSGAVFLRRMQSFVYEYEKIFRMYYNIRKGKTLIPEHDVNFLFYSVSSLYLGDPVARQEVSICTLFFM